MGFSIVVLSSVHHSDFSIINIKPHPHSDKNTGKKKQETGDFDSFKFKVMVSGALTDDVMSFLSSILIT